MKNKVTFLSCITDSLDLPYSFEEKIFEVATLCLPLSGKCLALPGAFTFQTY